MKAFLNYSGKGGVGKTTITYCLYRAMIDQGKDVMVLAMAFGARVGAPETVEMCKKQWEKISGMDAQEI